MQDVSVGASILFSSENPTSKAEVQKRRKVAYHIIEQRNFLGNIVAATNFQSGKIPRNLRDRISWKRRIYLDGEVKAIRKHVSKPTEHADFADEQRRHEHIAKFTKVSVHCMHSSVCNSLHLQTFEIALALNI